MTIEKKINGLDITLSLTGRLDTLTSAGFAEEFEAVEISAGSQVILDFKNLDYISSAGLSAILTAQKRVTALKAEMEIINANEIITDIFNMTGFSKFLKIRKS